MVAAGLRNTSASSKHRRDLPGERQFARCPCRCRATAGTRSRRRPAAPAPAPARPAAASPSAVAVGPGDRAHVADRDQAGDRPGQQRPDDDRRRAGVGRDRIGRRIGQREPRDGRGDERGEQRGQHQPQRQHAAQHLQREQRAAERHAVGRAPCRRPRRRPPAAGVARRTGARGRDSALAITAPACFGAPSRPSEAPMPTMITDSTALPSVRSVGKRPAENQIAAVMSMLLPLDRRTRTS